MAVATPSTIRKHKYIIDHDYNTEWSNVERWARGDPDARTPTEEDIFLTVMGRFFDGLHTNTLMTALDLPTGKGGVLKRYLMCVEQGDLEGWKTEIQKEKKPDVSLKDLGKVLWEKVQGQAVIEGGGRRGGGKKKLKINRLYKKRRNTKRRNTKRRNTKRKNTKRRNTKRRNTKRRV